MLYLEISVLACHKYTSKGEHHGLFSDQSSSPSCDDAWQMVNDLESGVWSAELRIKLIKLIRISKDCRVLSS